MYLYIYMYISIHVCIYIYIYIYIYPPQPPPPRQVGRGRPQLSYSTRLGWGGARLLRNGPLPPSWGLGLSTGPGGRAWPWGGGGYILLFILVIQCRAVATLTKHFTLYFQIWSIFDPMTHFEQTNQKCDGGILIHL